MSTEKFKADLEAEQRKQAKIDKLAAIIEFRLGRSHNNQALLNDIIAAGLLDTKLPTEDNFLDLINEEEIVAEYPALFSAQLVKLCRKVSSK